MVAARIANEEVGCESGFQAFCPTGGDARRYIYIVRLRIEGAFKNTTGAYRDVG